MSYTYTLPSWVQVTLEFDDDGQLLGYTLDSKGESFLLAALGKGKK